MTAQKDARASERKRARGSDLTATPNVDSFTALHKHQPNTDAANHYRARGFHFDSLILSRLDTQ